MHAIRISLCIISIQYAHCMHRKFTFADGPVRLLFTSSTSVRTWEIRKCNSLVIKWTSSLPAQKVFTCSPGALPYRLSVCTLHHSNLKDDYQPPAWLPRTDVLTTSRPNARLHVDRRCYACMRFFIQYLGRENWTQLLLSVDGASS